MRLIVIIFIERKRGDYMLIKSGILKDKNDNYFYPKTLLKYVKGFEKIFNLGKINGIENEQTNTGIIEYKGTPYKSILNDLIYTGTYLISGTQNEYDNLPFNGSFSIRVETLWQNYTIQWATNTDLQVTFKRFCSNKVWSEWNLVEGEVKLWEGTTNGGVADLPISRKELEKYGHILFEINNGEYMVECAYIDDNFLNGVTGWSANNVNSYQEVYSIGAYVKDTVLTVNKVTRISIDSNKEITFKQGATSITRVYGRP